MQAGCAAHIALRTVREGFASGGAGHPDGVWRGCKGAGYYKPVTPTAFRASAGLGVKAIPTHPCDKPCEGCLLTLAHPAGCNSKFGAGSRWSSLRFDAPATLLHASGMRPRTGWKAVEQAGCWAECPRR